jgi:hypothetical protein
MRRGHGLTASYSHRANERLAAGTGALGPWIRLEKNADLSEYRCIFAFSDPNPLRPGHQGAPSIPLSVTTASRDPDSSAELTIGAPTRTRPVKRDLYCCRQLKSF